MWTDPQATIVAAAIAAAVALVSLIISKEIKTSEFRQNWIDALRSEIGDAISSASALFILLDEQRQNNPDGLFMETWSKTTATLARIDLRLNLHEDDHQELSSLLRRAEQMLRDAGDGKSSSRDEREKLQDNVVKVSRKILKREWDRVKEGELAFRVLKIVSFLIVASLSFVALFHHFFW